MCPGYRNAADLMFHDQSTQIASRYEVNGSTAPGVGEDGKSEISSRLGTQAVIGFPVQLTDFVLYQLLDDLGLSFFMSTYVGDSPAVSQLYYLP